MKRYYIILFTLILGCQNQNVKITTNENEFEKYYSKILLLETPLTFKDGYLLDFESTRKSDLTIFAELDKLDSRLVNKYFPPAPWISRISGRIFESKEFISIIYRFEAEVIVPYLYTYTKEGAKIDSLRLSNAIGIDILGIEVATTKIDIEGNIFLSDTAKFDNLDPNRDNDSILYTVIKTEKHKLQSNGRFKKEFEKCDTIK